MSSELSSDITELESDGNETNQIRLITGFKTFGDLSVKYEGFCGSYNVTVLYICIYIHIML